MADHFIVAGKHLHQELEYYRDWVLNNAFTTATDEEALFSTVCTYHCIILMSAMVVVLFGLVVGF